jgi:hypothetical protein
VLARWVSHDAVLFALVIFEIGAHFVPKPAWTVVLLFMPSHGAEMTGICHSAQPLVEMVS